MKTTYQQLTAIFDTKGYAFFDGGKAYNINLFGVRSVGPLVNEFNDVMGVAYRDDFLNEQVFLFKATTKPGLFYLKNQLGNINGTAILVPGQYRGVWKLGFHKSYEALQQSREGVFKVWRDNNSNGELDADGPQYTDVQGLNGHTTSFKSNIDKVGQYSAGCQVIQDDLDFNILMSLVKKSAERFGNSFTYTLFDEGDFS